MATHKPIRAGIIGGAGYTGGEMLRILLRHPGVEIAFVHSRHHGGKPVYSVHADLLGDSELCFTDTWNQEIDVLFLCLGHGESRKFLETQTLSSHIVLIDLSQDFRGGGRFSGREFVYGLPEWQRESICRARNIANPGCFATAILLGLLPLAHAGLLREVHTTGITGSTGAGQQLQESTHFTWRSGNVNAYKSLSHQHLKEIRLCLGSLQQGFESPLHFIPWRGDFTRGIFITSYLESVLDLEQAVNLYQDYYQSHPFTFLSATMVDIKQVVNTNKVFLFLEKQGNQLLIHSVEDNLVKGASGQAVQNMNLVFGLGETEGLNLKPIAF